MTKYLFTGSRDWKDEVLVDAWFVELGIGPGDTVIEGGMRGLDNIAHRLCLQYGATPQRFFADWKGHGLMAGPIRNRKMYDTTQPDYVLGFPLSQSKGTWDMMNYASQQGVRVLLNCTDIGPPIKASGRHVPKGA